MSKSDSVPGPTVRRLSLYLRQLEAFRESNLQTVSSKQLGDALRITDAQVRKDLAYFGQFGQAGIGYNVEELITRVRGILGTDQPWNALVIGAGNLGRALLSYRGFKKKGFELIAVFDADETQVGEPVGVDSEIRIQPMSELRRTVEEKDIKLAVVAVPAEAAQAVADDAIEAGVRGILNFAPVALHVPPGISLVSLDLAVHLEQLSFQIGAAAAAQNNSHGA
jgi:redox-sensing transcriptional repressor